MLGRNLLWSMLDLLRLEAERVRRLVLDFWLDGTWGCDVKSGGSKGWMKGVDYIDGTLMTA